jgi:hypothetical protein
VTFLDVVRSGAALVGLVGGVAGLVSLISTNRATRRARRARDVDAVDAALAQLYRVLAHALDTDTGVTMLKSRAAQAPTQSRMRQGTSKQELSRID